MTSLQGHTYWAARLSTDANVDDDWTAYTLGETVGDKGGTAQVYRIAAKTTPPLLAKMYHSDSILQRIASDPGYGTRLMCLGMERATYLIGADGRVLKAWRKVKVPGHAEEVLKAARS